ncbi:ATP-binding protein [Bradyrhizobium sp. USDA 3458]|uniref:ATP-binding protein n=1 Tax=Bradyrhizobium sp. USDA 3458 TaxID=2591461 RepID=UPI001143578B|nr:ATP-binding protein [Bradyrhizobium sp. USDA 3458]
MTVMLNENWAQANRNRLTTLFADIREAIAQGRQLTPVQLEETDRPSRLDRLAVVFGLGHGDLVPLLLAAAQDIDVDVLAGERARVALALSLGGEDVWTALCPQAPLRRWRMIELEGAGGFSERSLHLDERILHYLLGLDYLDARLDGLVEPVPRPEGLFEEEDALAAGLASSWRADPSAGWPVLQLCGMSREPQRAVAYALATPLAQRLFRLARNDIPKTPYERLALTRLCDREMALSNSVLLIEGDSSSEEEERATASFTDLLLGPTVLAAREPLRLDRKRRLRADMPLATPRHRRILWQRMLDGRGHELGPSLDRIAEQFSLDSVAVRAAAELAEEPIEGTESRLADRLWDAARAQARQRLDGLVERIDGRVSWSDLVLPADQIAQLREIAIHVSRAHQVHEDWGWSARGTRGLGVTALFAGPSGTGKTMAAEVLANDLRLDLYRIDLSQVGSKYIGETEKNLKRIFEAAETSGAILLFDEADALFGRRSEVKDSHDRYANVEVSYLLQRMEAYRGLAILTTNLKSALDPAFMRRLRFVIEFPFPDASLRSEIWRRIFPVGTPVEPLDHHRLARLAISGGSIRTIAINAAFLAAEQGGAVTVENVMTAARREYGKLEKPITAAEFGGNR